MRFLFLCPLYDLPIKIHALLMFNYTIKIVIKKDKIRKDGKAPIYLQAFINKKRVRIHLNCYCKVSAFSEKYQKVKGNSEEVKQINAVINKRLSKANEIFYQSVLEDKPLDIETFKTLLLNEKSKHDFLNFMHNAIKGQEKNVEYSTIKNYIKAFNHLKSFQDEIKFFELTPKLIENYRSHLLRKGLKHNTVNSYLKQIKKFVRLAINEGYNIKNPFDEVSLKWQQSTPVWLEPYELEKFINFYYRPDLPYHFKDTLQMFLFMCGVGLRISDASKLKHSDIINDTIRIRVQKTKRYKLEETFIISDFAKQFLPKKQHRETVFKYGNSQKFNYNLKSICEHLGIKKEVSSHTARHTYATTLLLAGANIEVVSKLLGHKSLKDTMVYVHITKQAERKNLALFDKFLDKT